MTDTIQSGFVALIGRPNSGKSTLLNTILKQPLAIVSALPQTTRKTMRGIYNTPDLQIVFVDSPGIHQGKHAFNKAMSAQSLALTARNEVDVICYLVDCSRDFGSEEDAIVDAFMRARAQRIIVFNKTDCCPDVAEKKRLFYGRYPMLKTVPACAVSAPDPAASTTLLEMLKPMLPQGPRWFGEEDITDADMRFFAAEFIRKQIIANTREEVPHAVFVEITGYRETPSRHRVDATIHVESTGQKTIIIGRNGELIKQIQFAAARDLKELCGSAVTINTHVVVTPNWRDDKRFLTEMGY